MFTHSLDLQKLLRTSVGRYQTVHVVWTYRYNEHSLNELLERWAQNPDGYDMRIRQPQNEIKQVRRALWWDKAVGWRLETPSTSNIGQTTVQVVQGNIWWTSGYDGAKLVTNDQNLRLSQVTVRPPHVMGGADLERMQLLHPAFLASTHNLQFVQQTRFLDRPALEVHATYAQNAEQTLEPYFWAVADQYHLLIDSEYGVLLRYAAILDHAEIAVSTVEQVVFNQPIDPNLFDARAYLANVN